MSEPRPDYSVRMLRLFLRVQIHLERSLNGLCPGHARGAVKKRLSKAAGVTQAQVERAIVGTFVNDDTRRRLWAALGIKGAV